MLLVLSAVSDKIPKLRAMSTMVTGIKFWVAGNLDSVLGSPSSISLAGRLLTIHNNIASRDYSAAVTVLNRNHQAHP